MKYVLSKKEYIELKNAARKLDIQSEEIINDLCQKVADHFPIVVSWLDDKTPRPWGCIHSTDDEHYCDECPVENVCTMHKNWSQ